MAEKQWKFWVDRGGTFTDILARKPDGALAQSKLLSENPAHYPDAALEGIRRFLAIKPEAAIPAKKIHSIRLGTTVATNALLERKGEPTVLITSQGFKDSIRLAYQQRPELFALKVEVPSMLYEAVIEAPERIDKKGEDIIPFQPEAIRTQLTALYQQGFRSVAIVLMHSYLHPQHEHELGQLCRAIGFSQVSLSSQVTPLIKLVGRGDTTLVEAYLAPILNRYITYLQTQLPGVDIAFMKSNGGLVSAELFCAKDSILSGPAGGIVGATSIAKASGFKNIISFDMGGTSTDVAHFAGQYEQSFETEIAGARMRVPILNIHTIAAGGGSIVQYKDDRFQVGPNSAGAHPGPASYGNGGPLTITDCNILLGKIQPDFFPKVFGHQQNEPLNKALVIRQFDQLAQQLQKKLNHETIAAGFIDIAVNNMANAIKKISVQKGRDTSTYTLVTFGGAGGQHACLVAEKLNIKRILLHPYAGVLSAYGIGLADIKVGREKMIEQPISSALSQLDTAFAELEQSALNEIKQQTQCNRIKTIKTLHIKYQHADAVIELPFNQSIEHLTDFFTAQHLKQYGFINKNKPLIIEMISLEIIAQVGEPVQSCPTSASKSALEPLEQREFFTRGCWQKSPLYNRETLPTGMIISGPALIMEQTSTIVLEPGWTAVAQADGNLILTHVEQSEEEKPVTQHEQADPIALEIFNNLFMSIAEEMGEALINTAHSVNIKERRDFSCAIFNKTGDLIANAPHIPVHLGSMSSSIKAIINKHKGCMKPGDVYLLNDPYAGGTHLPDITVITPVFYQNETPAFYVGTRGHHADIGGITPGSMPANSSHIEEEGVLFTDFMIVKAGIFQEQRFVELLTQTKYPARNPAQNISDIQAQIAANQRGVVELKQIIAQHSYQVVDAYMTHIQNNAEEIVRKAIGLLHSGQHQIYLDSGEMICVKISVNHESRSAIIDFTGTSPQSQSNFNAPAAITTAAVLYVFRCLVNEKIPLNAGCLKPFKLVIPERSLLNPHYPCAVVAGNVETSQNIVDALFAALGLLAPSQGTMNNLTFGNQTTQYYETIAGGMGASAKGDGASGIQIHMTNTRLTDPEVLEQRFPILLEDFKLRKDSGGTGQYQGGDGVIRKIKFLEPMQANILSSHREKEPTGIKGGNNSLPGNNYAIRASGEVIYLKGADKIQLNSGDCLVIETPGGGGFGAA